MLKKLLILLTLSTLILFLSLPVFPGGDNPKGADPWDDVKNPTPSNGGVVYRMLIVGGIPFTPQIIIITPMDKSSSAAATKGKNSGEGLKTALSSSKTNKK
jgi:hypothetical protein